MELSFDAGQSPLVERIKALDQSTAPFANQALEAFDLAGSTPISREQLLTFHVDIDLSSSSFNPKHDWTFRWLLRRLEVGDAGFDSPSVHYEAWILLAQLVQKIPVKVLARLVQKTNFATVLVRTLGLLNAKLNQSHSEDGNQVIDSEPRDIETEAETKPVESELTRKRKRDSEGNVSTDDNVLYDVTNTFSVLISISHALRTLQTKVSQNTTEDLAFAAYRIKSTLHCSIEDAAKIIRHFSECIIRSVEGTPNDISIGKIFEAVIEPFLELWRIRKVNPKDDDNLSEARLVARLLLVPISKLWRLFDPLSRARQVLQALVTASCLQPYVENAILSSRGINGDRSHFRQIANDLASSIFTDTEIDSDSAIAVGTSTEAETIDTHNGKLLEEACFVTPIAFRFAIMSTFGEKKKVGPKESLWIQEFFKALAMKLGFNVEKPLDSRKTPLGLEALHNMLLVLLPYNYSPGTTIIEAIILHFCGVSSEAVVENGWRLTKLCIDLDHQAIVITNSKENSNKGTQRILAPLLHAISASCKHSKNEALETQDTKSMKHELIISLINAFIRAHAFPSFIDVWEEQMAAQFKDFASSQSIDKVLWDDPVLQTEISNRLISTATPAQRTTLLEKRLSSLKFYPSAILKFEEEYAALVVSTCLLEAMSSLRLPAIPLQTALDFQHVFAPRLIGLTFPSRFNQALWRPMAMIYATCPHFKSTADRTWLLRQASDIADETILDLTRHSQRTVDEYENGLSALTFLAGIWSASESFNDSDRSHFARSLQSVFHGLLATPHEVQGSAPIPLETRIWTGEKYSVSSNQQFVLACCYTLIAYPTVFDVLDSSSARKFVEYVSRYPLWQSLRKSAAAHESPMVANAIRQVQLRAFCDGTHGTLEPTPNRATHIESDNIAIHNLHDLQFEKLSKDDRTQLANRITTMSTEGVSCITRQQSLLYVLLQLSENPNKGMDMVTRPSRLIDIAQQIDGLSGYPFQNLPLLEALTNKVLSYNLQSLSKDQDAPEAHDFQMRASQEIDHFNMERPQLAMTTVIATAVRFSRRTANRGLAAIDESSQKKFMKALIQRLVKIRSGGGCWDGGLAAVLEITASLKDLLASTSLETDLIGISQAGLTGRQHVRKFFEDFKGQIQDASYILFQGDVQKQLEDSTVGPIIAKAHFAIAEILAQVPEQDGGPDDVDPLRGEWLVFFKNPDEAKIRIGKLTRDFQSFTVDKKTAALRKFVQIESDSGAQLLPNELHLLYRLVGSPIPHGEQSESLKMAFGLVFSALVESTMTKEIDMNSAVAKLTILNAMLSKNPWAIIQYHIESTFTLVATLVSSSCELEPGGPVRKSYNMLITLLRTIFTLHRPKTGRRYHNVLPALQGLLRSLYTPYETTSQFPQSKWIQDGFANPKIINTSAPSSSDLDCPGPDESLLFSRLLTTITEPQPSTLKATGLTDPTKKAKAEAGTHLLYLIQEYCVLQLRGKMEPEVQRNLLEPGLYSILSIMTPGLRQVCGEALDKQGREVYRELIASWR